MISLNDIGDQVLVKWLTYQATPLAITTMKLEHFDEIGAGRQNKKLFWKGILKVGCLKKWLFLIKLGWMSSFQRSYIMKHFLQQQLKYICKITSLFYIVASPVSSPSQSIPSIPLSITPTQSSGPSLPPFQPSATVPQPVPSVQPSPSPQPPYPNSTLYWFDTIPVSLTLTHATITSGTPYCSKCCLFCSVYVSRAMMKRKRMHSFQLFTGNNHYGNSYMYTV